MLLIFVDTETSGLDAHVNHVLEIALIIYDLNEKRVVDTFERIVKVTRAEFNVAVSAALDCNGFTFDELSSKGVKIEVVRGELEKWFQKNKINRYNAKFIAHNSSFDKSFFNNHLISEERQRKLQLPYHWLDFPSMNFVVTLQNMRDVGNDEYMTIPFAKDHVAEYHDIDKEQKPHRAMNGAKHLLLLFQNIIG